MNSGISTVSSLRTIPGRNATPASEAGRSPSVAASSPAVVAGTGAGNGGSWSPVGKEQQQVVAVDHQQQLDVLEQRRKSMGGARNYFMMGGGQRQSRRVSRVVSGIGGELVRGGSLNGGASGGVVSPFKKRRPVSTHQQQRSSMLRISTVELAGEGREGKENKDNNGGNGGFKMVAGEFTFEMGSFGKGGGSAEGLGLREGSSGDVNQLLVTQQQQQTQPLLLPYKLTVSRGTSRNGSPIRQGGASSRGSMKSIKSLELYDRQ